MVAIKVLDSDGDDSRLGRFRNEASAAGNLHHENIVTVHEFGEENGIQYLVMEYLQGQDLQKVLHDEKIGSRPPLTVLEKINVMSQVADGLHYAHRSGVLHRDIKPANIMLLSDGGVKIMDFGIARLTRDNSTRLTQQGFLIGTVLYMAPELLTGADVDVLCDIWSYGVIYYEMLAGKNPFETGNLHSEMYRIAHEDPPRLTAEQCPATLQPVVQRLLSRDRELRYQSLEDVRFDTAPILLELRRLEAEKLLPQAQDLCAGQAWEEAQAIVRSVLELDPQNREGRLLREQIQHEMHKRAIRPRVEALLRRANEQVEQRRFREAIEIFESARRLDSTDEQVNSHLAQVRTAKERNDRADQLLANAQQELDQNHLTGALERASEALKVDPKHPGAEMLIGRIQQEIKEREAEKSVQSGLLKARALIAIESFEDASALLTELVAANPDRREIQDLLTRTAAQKNERDRRRKLEAALERAKESLETGDLLASNRTLELLAREFPGNQDVADLLAYVRQEQENRERAESLEAVQAQVASLIQSHRFPEALIAVQEQIKRYPDEIALSQLLRLVVTSQRAHEKTRRREEAILSLDAMCQRGAWKEAATVVQTLLDEFPGDAELLALQRQIQSEQEKQEREDDILQTAQNARKLIDASRPADAVKLLQKALQTYPGDPRLNIVLDRANNAAREQENEKYVASQLAAAAELEQKRDWEAALARIREARERFPNRKELDQVEQEIAAAMAGAERADKIAAEEWNITREIDIGNWTAAFDRIALARKTYADDQLFSALLEQGERRRREEMNALIEETRAKLIEGKLDEAGDLLHTRLHSYSTEPAVRSLAEELEFEKTRREEITRREQEKRSYVDARLAAIGEQESARNWEGAAEAARVGLRKYPNHPDLLAAQWRIQTMLEQVERDRRTAAEVQGVEEMLGRGDWPGAIARIEALQSRDPDEPAYPRLWVVARRQKTKELQALLTHARRLFSSGDLQAAGLLLRERSAIFASEPEFSSLTEEIASEQARREEALRSSQEKKEFVSRALARSSELDARGDHSGAIEMIREALRRFPADDVLLKEQQRLEEAARKLERERRVAFVVKTIRGLLDSGKWDEALTQIQKANREFPQEPVLTELRELARDKRQSEIDGLVTRARAELAAGNLTASESLLAKLRLYAHDPTVKLLTEDLSTERFLKDRETAARQHIAARRFVEAEQAIQEIAGRSPGREAVHQLEIALREEQQRARREAAYNEGLADARHLAQARQYAEAIDRYTALLVDFPGDPQLTKELQEAEKTRDRERKKLLESEIARLKKLRRAGAAEEVRSAALVLLQQEDSSQVRELIVWAEGALSAERIPVAEPRRSGSTPSSSSRATATPSSGLLPWLPIAAACVGAMVAGLVTYHFWRPHPLEVNSTELAFTYTGATIGSQQLVLKGGRRAPDIHSDSRWLTAAMTGRTDPVTVDVRVDPVGLTPGDYSGKLTLTAGSSSSETQVVTVNLTVQPPEPKPTLSRAPAILTVSPSNITFADYKAGTPAPAPQTIQVTSENPASGLAVNIVPMTSCGWLRWSATAGVTPWELKSFVNTNGLQSARTYTCTFSIRGENVQSPTTMTASLNVLPSAIAPTPSPGKPISTLSISTSTLQFGVYQLDATAPAFKTISVTSSNPESGLPFSVDLGNSCGWLRLSTTRGVTASQVVASVNTQGLSPGNYTCPITFNAVGVSNSSPSASATITVTAPAPIQQIVDCHAPTYTGIHYGDISWSGALEPNATLVFGGPDDEDLHGGRLIRRQRFPGCDVTVRSLTSGIEIIEPPSTKNGFRRVKIRNASKDTIPFVEIHWAQK